MNKPSTPVNVSELGRVRKKHPNCCFVNSLIHDLVQGFLAVLGVLPKMSHVCNNLLSALKEPEIVDKLLSKEVEKGSMMGPFDDPLFPIFCINPNGIVTRKYSRNCLIICEG